MKIALLVGGPSPERGISLNSARSLADHIPESFEVSPIVYFDKQKRPFEISREKIYSNTPDDFEFELAAHHKPLADSELKLLLSSSDIVFSTMHGEFGEDGQIQEMLENWEINFVGPSSEACRNAYDKFRCAQALIQNGLPTIPSALLEPSYLDDQSQNELLSADCVVLKPSNGGSSLNVVAAKCQLGAAPRIVIQPYVKGVEFTTVVVERANTPIALIPVEVELRNKKSDLEILDFRRKYLATDDARYYCPPRKSVSDESISEIRRLAQETFTALELRDFARIDCRLTEHGEILISDVNPISGMEQNSFLFIQAAQIGLTHSEVIQQILESAFLRLGICLTKKRTGNEKRKKKVPVLFGGQTAERQVSVLSGTNVWLKLLRSNKYAPVPYLLSGDGKSVWQLTYGIALRHSVEQIEHACKMANSPVDSLEMRRNTLASEILSRLEPMSLSCQEFIPTKISLQSFLDSTDFVFIALHGGMGENGEFQKRLEQNKIGYNGSDEDASRLCMDKFATSKKLEGLKNEGIEVSPKRILRISKDDPSTYSWQQLCKQLDAKKGLVLKPRSDGCSTGVVPIATEKELSIYLAAATGENGKFLHGFDFSKLADDQVVQLPDLMEDIIVERFESTDSLAVEFYDEQDDSVGCVLRWGEEAHAGWVEITVGLLGHNNRLIAMPPSLTVARNGVLSVEEKFMGGTGINMTPPPSPPLGKLNCNILLELKSKIEKIGHAIGVEGYARVDAFLNYTSGELIVIEINSLPALTPSTVLFHQALQLQPMLKPIQFLEKLIDLGIEKHGVAP